MEKKAKGSRVCALLPLGIVRKIEIIGKIEGRTEAELVEQAVKEFAPREIEEKELNKKALYLFLDSKLSYDDLVRIIGKEKASAAKYTKDIRKKGRELLDTLEK